MKLTEHLGVLARGGKLAAGQIKLLEDDLRPVEGAVARVNAAFKDTSRNATLRTLVVDGDLEVPAGIITIGPIASGKSNVKISAGGIQLRNNTTVKIDLQTDGDIFIGEDTSAAATTNIAIFTAAQTYNSESVSAGDVLYGDNSTSKANLLWDKSEGRLKFRSGATTGVYIDTDGSMVFSNNKRLNWRNAADNAASAFIVNDGSDTLSINNSKASEVIQLSATMTDTNTHPLTWGEDTGLANRTQLTLSDGAQGAKISLAGAVETYISVAGGSGGTTEAVIQGNIHAVVSMSVTDGVTAPTAVSGRAFIYVDTADGDLKVRFGDNVTKTLATDT